MEALRSMRRLLLLKSIRSCGTTIGWTAFACSIVILLVYFLRWSEEEEEEAVFNGGEGGGSVECGSVLILILA
jgi:hypothetical protein